MKLWKMAGRFLRVGSMGFGGPMALVGLMQEQLVEKTQEVDPDDFATGVALGQILPGPVAVDCATYIGYRQRGFLGAIVSTVAVILPAFVLMLILTPLYFAYGTVPQVSGFFHGVAPAIVAVVIMAGYNLSQRFKFNTISIAIAVLAGVGLCLGVSPVLLILGAGLVGLLAHGRQVKQNAA